MSSRRVKVIDLFAGPGGLGEGFTSIDGKVIFDIALSIEKDQHAHSTLLMRARYRELQRRGQLGPYYALANGASTIDDFLEHPDVKSIEPSVQEQSRLWEMSPDNRATTTEMIRKKLNGADDWVLIGGPPCQAYSLVGRARNTNVADFHEDARHFLYEEYLNVLTTLQPPVFVMENVKGLLSSRNRDDGGMFEKIYQDLSEVAGKGYTVYSVSTPFRETGIHPSDFIVRSERYGVPQARHRVILLGIRNDVPVNPSELLLQEAAETVTAAQALSGLRKLRSRISRHDSYPAWRDAVRRARDTVSTVFADDSKLVNTIADRAEFALGLRDTGGDYVPLERESGDTLATSFLNSVTDLGLNAITGHRTRSHMPSDLHRYFFAAIFAGEAGASPKIADFPLSLLPKHRNVQSQNVRAKNAPFQDRFRVVRPDKPANTVVAHMAKDGHAFIHWDPGQIRSLTIREAARLQTFPDNYLFLGPQTARYSQIGNAVPPILAKQVAGVVAQVFYQSARPAIAPTSSAHN